MKKLIFSLAFVTLTIASFSQAPQGFSYQAILRNSDGTLKANESVSLQIDIVNDMGVSSYLEIHNTQTNEFGLVNLVIGEGATSDDLSMVDWANGPYFIDITVNGANMGSGPLLSVPYALYAASGNPGPQGPAGMPGTQGEMGPLGPKGDTGDIGDPGPKGPKGEAGEVGPQGDIGPIGSQGVPGDTKWTEASGGINYGDGRVGIGTSNPATSLQLNASHVPQLGQFVISAPSGQDIQYSFVENGEVVAYLWWDSDKEVLRLQNSNNGDMGLNPSGGNVGIGTDTPNATLDVDGDLHVSGDILVEGEGNEGPGITIAELIDLMNKEGIVPNNYAGTVKDIEGRIYKTVKIGTQTWMAEDLRTRHFNDSSFCQPSGSLDQFLNETDANNPTCMKMSSIISLDNKSKGTLYNAHAVLDERGLCPFGWHVPTAEEWEVLVDYLGGPSVAGGKLKAAGPDYWNWGENPMEYPSNESGFTALRGGRIKEFNEVFFNVGGYWWSSPPAKISRVRLYDWSNYAYDDDATSGRTLGTCIRCIKD